MNKLIKYGLHQLRAKGRHGTHSPFVYAFVEAVLRSKEQIYSTGNRGTIPGTFSDQELQLLYRTIRFLHPQAIALPGEIYGNYAQLVELVAKETVLYEFSDRDPQLKSPALIFIDGHLPLTHEVLATELFLAHPLNMLLCLQPHRDARSEALWDYLCNRDVVSISLDYWHFGLLVHDDSFKARQHFYLR